MRKIFTIVLLSVASFFTSSQEAVGIIDEIKVCGTGNEQHGDWIRTLQFKVDSKWFATYAEKRGYDAEGNKIASSIVYLAFSQGLPVKVQATDAWTDTFKVCGSQNGSVFNGNKGDYIHISR